jgi:DNA-binding NarL/FixJ family response regulator
MAAMTTSKSWDQPDPDPFVGQQWVAEPDRIAVGIVDDEVLIRTGVREVLDHVGEIEVVGEACDGPGAVWLATAHRPQVLLIDTAMPGMPGPRTVAMIRRRVPTTQIVVLAAADDGQLLLPMLQAGTAGFLFKDGDPGALVRAVRVVAAGGTFLSPPAARLLVDHLVGSQDDRRDEARQRIALLKTREREVLRYVGQGWGNARIARVMYLSEGAIKAHVSRVLAKLRCDNRVQAALIARDAALG